MHSRALSGNDLWRGGHFAVDMFEPHTITLAAEVAGFGTRHLLVGALLMLV
jgi:hypothetical protein